MIPFVEFGTYFAPLYAYLDPGTGSMILQAVLAAVAAVAVTASFWWHRLLVLLRIRKPPAPPHKAASADGEREMRDS